MKFSYKFSNLCGSVYKSGNVLFTPDGNSVLSPVGNRVTLFDLVRHSSQTLPFENLKNIATLALSPDGKCLLSIDEDGRALFVNFHKRVVVARHHFKKPVRCARFSPDSRYLAVSHGAHVQVWFTPSMIMQFRPFQLLRTYTGQYDDVLTLDWSADGLFFAAGSRDMTVRIYSLHPIRGYMPLTLTGHRNHVVGVFFATDRDSGEPTVYSLGKDGALFVWKYRQVETPAFRKAAKKLVSTLRRRQEQEEEEEEEEEQEDAESDSDDEEDESDESEDEDEEEEEEESEDETKEEDDDPNSMSNSNQDEKRAAASLTAQQRATVCKLVHPLARGTFSIGDKHYFHQQHAKIMCAALHRPSRAQASSSSSSSPSSSSSSSNNNNNNNNNSSERKQQAATLQACVLVVGFSNGVFGLYELPDFNNIHTLSVSRQKISTVAINNTGEWLAFGAEKLGQLLVWEWQSETYVLKQQGHFFDLNAIAYSPDGQLVVTGGDDGKVKLWNTTTGFCFVTFTDHSGPVRAVEFSPTGNVVFSASLDGTVRAFDLVRYRNFRTMTSPTPAQFVSLSIDPSGEIVVAGSLDPFDVYAWSLQTGQLLDVFAGHTGPISGIAFNPSDALMATSSWDHSVRIWDVFTRKASVETLQHPTDVLAVAFRPDGKELCSAALNGKLYFWDVYNAKLKSTIEGTRDIRGGRRSTDVRMASTATHSTAFTSVCYSSDGRCVLAGGNSKFVCIYEISHKILLRKFQITQNRSFDGLLEHLNSKYMTEAGALDSIDDVDSDDNSDVEDRIDRSLPGAKTGDFSSRKTKVIARTKSVRFSPTGQQWAAASTEGLLIYSLDETATFDPYDLDIEITPDNTMKVLNEDKKYAQALVMGLRLNEAELLRRCVEATPYKDIALVVNSLPHHHIGKMIEFFADALRESRHVQFYLMWVRSLLTNHGAFVQSHANKLMTSLRALQQSLKQQQHDLSDMFQANKYMLQYLASVKPSRSDGGGRDEDDDEVTGNVSDDSNKIGNDNQPSKKQKRS